MWKISTSKRSEINFILYFGYLSAAPLNVIFPFHFDRFYSVLWLHCFSGHQVIIGLKFNKIFMIGCITVTCQINFTVFLLVYENFLQSFWEHLTCFLL